MPIENKELQTKYFNSKEELVKGNIDNALVGLKERTNETINFLSDLNRIGLEIRSYGLGEDGKRILLGINNILSQYLNNDFIKQNSKEKGKVSG